MKSEFFQEAIAIISSSNSIKVSFNVPVNDNYSHVHQILIHNSNATVINDLVQAGFSLSMCDKGLSVDRYQAMEKYVLYYRYTCDRTGEEWGDNEECFAESSEDAVKIGKSRIHPFAQNNKFLVSVTLNGKQVWHV